MLTVLLAVALTVLLTTVSLIAFRQFSITTAKDHVRTVADLVRVSLTEAMINGSIDKRQQMLLRIASVDGLLEARVVRGEGVTKEYGQGLESEQAVDAIERDVLKTGIPYFEMTDALEMPIFRGTIPFIATDSGNPNCLQCHHVQKGRVLGAVTVLLSVSHLRNKALLTILIMTIIVAVFALVITSLFRRQIIPVVRMAQDVQKVVAKARDGDFSHRIRFYNSQETIRIARDLNRLMIHLEQSLGNISQDVAKLIQYDLKGNTNLLSTTIEMVDTLVQVSQFKQAIEEDRTRREVYGRMARVLTDQFNVHHFSIYEVSANTNHMRPVIVDGDSTKSCQWCNPGILSQADACRAQRTGHAIDSVETPYLCDMFEGRGEGVLEEAEHICLPVIHSGSVGSVIQIVTERKHGRMFQLLVPFIKVYLRESASVVEAKKLLDTLRKSALTDALTGLHNRRYLEEYVEAMVAMANRKGHRISVLMMDLDHFKEVNDTYGHDAGDVVLKTLARTLEKQVRTSDMVIRYGGEEFMVILQESDTYSGDRVAEKIRAAVEAAEMTIPGGVLKKTISIGVSRFPTDGNEFWEVAKYADLALYKAKSEGRNRVMIYQKDICMVP
ncbi:MAG: diguanylate cyclase [Magnetococcales bacterium]|nr:diguanylate cyclase [Magnetococcales bacterium]